MASLTSTYLNDFPECRDAVGRLVVFYAELESIQLSTVAAALGIEMADAARLLYRARSEAHRLDIADATMRPFFTRHKRAGEFAQWLGAMRHCKAIRNQYAHAIWRKEGDTLFFGDLDAAAKPVDGPALIPFYPIDLALLEKQEDFFAYTENCAWFLSYEAERIREGRPHSQKMPKASPLPKRYNRQD